MNERLKEMIDLTIKEIRSTSFVPPVRSLMDTDVYKPIMGQFIGKYYPGVDVTFRLMVRDRNIKLWEYVDQDELRMSLDHVRSLSMRKTDLYYLRGMDLYEKYMFGEEYLAFLQGFRLPEYELKQSDGVLDLSFSGEWKESSPWEIPAMAILSQLYYRGIMRRLTDDQIRDLYIVADNRLQNKLQKLKKHPTIRLSDFGTRRRHSFLWHKYVVGEMKRVLGDQFIGTSNLWLAMHYDLNAIGTNAHELPMVATALANSSEEMKQAQYDVLWKWQEMYGKALRVLLPDTYGSKQFFANAPLWLTLWGKQRQDSGNPQDEIKRYKTWLASYGISEKERMTIPSDGLTEDTMISLDTQNQGGHPLSYGYGTGGTNDFEGTLPDVPQFRPFSMVIKAVSANGRPCVKLSNDINKATGPKSEIARYLEVFGTQDRTERQVFV